MDSATASYCSGLLSRARATSQREPRETDDAYEDRIAIEATRQMRREASAVPEDREQNELRERFIAAHVAGEGCMARLFCDCDMRLAFERLHRHLQREMNATTPIRRLLLDRLLLAVNDGIRYERMSMLAKYRVAENSVGALVSDHPHHIKYLAEIRKGKESADERILRYAQALQPQNAQVVVQTTNAFFANNQQVNQGAAPKDLEKTSERLPPYAKVHS